MKKITKRNVKDLPSIGPFIREQEKDPEMKVLMDRAGLRIEVARATKTACCGLPRYQKLMIMDSPVTRI